MQSPPDAGSPVSADGIDNFDVTFAQQVPGEGDGGAVLGVVLVVFLFLILIGGCVGGGVAVYRQHKKYRQVKSTVHVGHHQKIAGGHEATQGDPTPESNDKDEPFRNYNSDVKESADAFAPELDTYGIHSYMDNEERTLIEDAQQYATEGLLANDTEDVPEYMMGGRNKFNTINAAERAPSDGVPV